METIKDILLIIFSATTFYYAFRYRKKDFQITILKEQMAAYKLLVEILSNNTKRLNEVFDETVPLETAFYDGGDLEQIPSLQTYFYKEKFRAELLESFYKIQNMIYLLPDDVIEASLAYFNYLDNLFLNENDLALAAKLLDPLDQKVLDVVNAIRNHIGVDDLSTQTRKMISKRPVFLSAEEGAIA